jgi:glycosyltransferase involved in cell wall biosynthesis
VTSREVWFVVPGDVDDDAAPSGGNVYDRRVRDGLPALGWRTRPVLAAGAWPRPAAADAGERRALRAASAVVATSAATARRVIDRHGLDRDRIRVAPPGVDAVPAAVPTPAGGRLLSVASVTPRKGHDVLVEALAGVADLPWTCVTEALARGIPVLASHVDGVHEALGTDGNGPLPGMLVPPGDAAALADAVRGWLTDPARRHRWRAAAAARRAALPPWEATLTALAAALNVAPVTA